VAQVWQRRIPVTRIALFLSILVTLAVCTMRGQDTPAQRPLLESNALELDEHGNLVPATLPHIYRCMFLEQNSLEEESDKLLRKGITTGSVRHALWYELGMTEADSAVFESEARRYAGKEKEINGRIAAIRKADLALHPNTWALTPKARTAVHALFAEQEEALNNELAAMKAGLSASSAAALDRAVVHRYAKSFYAPGRTPYQEKRAE
jgi:hypothetical protein